MTTQQEIREALDTLGRDLRNKKLSALQREILARPVDEVLPHAEAVGSTNAYADYLLGADRERFLAHEAAFFEAVKSSKQDGRVTRFIEVLTHEQGLGERYEARVLSLVDTLKAPYNQFIAGYLLLEAYGEKHRDRARALLVDAMLGTQKKGGSSDMTALLDERIRGESGSLKIRACELLIEHFGAAALDDVAKYQEENAAIRLRYLRMVKDKLGDAGAPLLVSRGLFHAFDKRSKYGDVDFKTYIVRCLGILEGVDFSSEQKRIWKDFAGHKTEKIRDAAAAALAGLGDGVLESASAHLAAKDAPTRTTAVKALCGAGTPAALAALEAHLAGERSKKIKLLIETRLAEGGAAVATKPAAAKNKAAAASKKKKKSNSTAAPKAATTATTPAAAGALGDGRDAELEALLAEDPDDVERALVYGDWLQGRGDPRGTLIALAAAAEAAPHDAARAKAAEAWLQEHDSVLWGFSKRRGERVEATWSLGFVRSARLELDEMGPLLETLRALLAHPSACVLQRLHIAPFSGRGRLDVEPVVELLCEIGAPVTLTHLSIGEPGQFRGDARLEAVFPRLAESAGTRLAAAMARVAEQRALKVPFGADQMAELVPREADFEGEVDVAAILNGLRMELDKSRPVGVVDAISRTFTRESLDAFALSLLEAWRAAGSRGADRWAFDAVGALGGERCVASLGAELPELSHQRCDQAMQHLLRIGSDAAVCEVIGLWITPSRYQPRRENAERALRDVARARGIDLDTLVVRSCPRAPRGEAERRIVSLQRRWLQRAMVDGQRIDARDFREHLMFHALRRPLCRTLLFGRFAPGGKRDALFRIGDDGPIDDAGKPVALGARADEAVGVMHPLELDDKALERWRAVFGEPARPRIKQPFEQLSRPTFTLDDDERKADRSERFAARRVGFHRLREGLEGCDWPVYVADHGIEAFARSFARGPAVVVADLRGNSGAIDELWATRPGNAGRGFYAKRLALGELDPIVVSEALYDIETVLGPEQRARPAKQAGAPSSAPSSAASSATAASDVLPQRGKYPYAELAKSSRSKCVVCGEKIEKGTVRVGVERVIETPNFSGRATAWLHPDCRDGCAELATVDDVEAALTKNSGGAWPP